MKKRLPGMMKWLALAVFVLAAGCCYSCGLSGPTEGISHEEETQEELPAVQETSEEPSQTCFVHVCGEVADPGVYELTEGQRVFEAVELAGGFTADAAENSLNLAEPVRDGMKIQVPDKAQAAASGGSFSDNGIAGGGAGAVTKVNINTATKQELMRLKGIGEARAEDIIRCRQERGGFDRIEDIKEVSGIKDAAFQKIKDDITV